MAMGKMWWNKVVGATVAAGCSVVILHRVAADHTLNPALIASLYGRAEALTAEAENATGDQLAAGGGVCCKVAGVCAPMGGGSCPAGTTQVMCPCPIWVAEEVSAVN
jgi:hypothetical protein